MKNIINKYKQLKVNHQSLTTNHFSVGFTLIELIIVIGIIGLIGVMGVTSYVNSLMQARNARRKSDMKSIQTCLETYYNSNQAYPIISTTGACNRISGSINCGGTTTITPTDPTNDCTYAYIVATTTANSYQITSLQEKYGGGGSTITITNQQ